MEINKRLIDYFDGDALAAAVWIDKYKNEGELTPKDMHNRMAKEFARIEYNYGDAEYEEELLTKNRPEFMNLGLTMDLAIYLKLIYFRNIIPQGSIMAQLGNIDSIGSLSNCFVIGQPEDSYGGILKKDEELVQLMKRRGGVGIDISTLRPAGTKVTNTAGSSTGAASFMERYSSSTREVAQNGRRGALMLTMDCRHPDVFDFVNSKKDRTKVTGANISVMLRDDFMEAVKNDEDYILRWPCGKSLFEFTNFSTTPLDYNISKIFPEGVIKKVRAKELYDAIVENAWENAEPGQMFVDRHHDQSPDSVYSQYRGVTSNPCGEIFMQEYDACRLMALNLLSIVENPFKGNASIDFNLLYENAYLQQRLADDLVDLELEHIYRILSKLKQDPESIEAKRVEIELWEKVYDTASSGRRTGCGFTALADMLAALGLKYDSDDAVKLIEQVMRIKMKAELDSTIDMAIERGPFKGWDPTKETPESNAFYKHLSEEFPEQYERMMKYGRRNVSWSTCAPTGSVSILTQTTSGLEPLFSPYYIRRKKVNPTDPEVRVDFIDDSGDKWMEYPVAHTQLKNWFKVQPEYSQIDFSTLKRGEVEEVFQKSPWYKSCANDIDWKTRIEIQNIIQKYTTHSISSTLNLPNNVTKEEVAAIYLHAFEKQLKGVTVYRDGCRTGVLVTEQSNGFEYKDAVKRPSSLKCDIFNVVAKGKMWTVIVGLLDNKPYEVFAIDGHTIKETPGLLKKVKQGVYNVVTDKTEYEDVTSKMSAEEEVITRLISTALRHGAGVQFIVEQLDKSVGDITSFSKAIARTLKRYIPEEILIARSSSCPNCNEADLIFEEGCKKCNSCGYSAC